MKPASDTEVADWLTRAGDDLRGAKLLLAAGLQDLACFHCQQAAEKALKALLLALGREPARTHDLNNLASALDAAGVAREAITRDALYLTPFAVLPRYPGWGRTDPATAADAMSAAERVLAFVSVQLQS